MGVSSPKGFGGGRGIRTPGGLAAPAVFKTAPFNRSGIPPRADSRITAPIWPGHSRCRSGDADASLNSEACPRELEGKASFPCMLSSQLPETGCAGTTETVAQPPLGHVLAMPPNWRRNQALG